MFSDADGGDYIFVACKAGTAPCDSCELFFSATRRNGQQHGKVEERVSLQKQGSQARTCAHPADILVKKREAGR